ncbi:protein AMN1 homolog [Rhipicephalus microplus]|uniref:protein AMN1 homolog n=1 Tax=Rhipicephalus microplus TaxID=6941 RepID=UPI003F6C15BA
MDEQRGSGGQEVHLLQDICLDAITGFRVVKWFRHVVLPHSLADYYYTRLQRQRSLKDHLVPVVLHAKSIEADLAESPVTAAALVHVRKCTQLEKLTFSSVRSNDSLCEMSLLETVKCFQNLRWLELSGVSAVTDTVLAAIAEQNKLLTVLKLNECVNIGDGGLEALGRNCHFLKSLDFSSTQITMRGVDILANSPCKVTIEEFLADRCSKLETDAVQAITTNFPSLRILAIEYHRANDVEPEAISMRMEKKGEVSWFVFY